MKQYTPAKYVQGLCLCLENVNSLVSDATCLFEHVAYPRSFALSLIAIEEAGKINMLRSWLSRKLEGKEITPDEIKFRGDLFVNHERKTSAGLLALYAAQSFKDQWGMNVAAPKEVASTLGNARAFQKRKQSSLYLHIGSGGFEAPRAEAYATDAEQWLNWASAVRRWIKGALTYYLEVDPQITEHLKRPSRGFEENTRRLKQALDGI
jgi:AbiV family abortive infection protein